ncbi:xanthine dehydrogenase/oxidase-like isoform X1 [Pieris napi]|uniref:xanthine dehydrogenase/oxidase-like isoform X1 n=1 Tax=Pieris napi TaxID=78633 RepID=UPI001FBA34DB|nr:xanthine dehydrogenase/oxidase-like isoform X1 [Pieris napi]
MDKVKFKVNDIECVVGSEASSTTTLLNYIRQTLELRGTKYMCLEGGCGACIVSVKTPEGDILSVNSCLVSVMSCHNWEITTIEGVGNRDKGYHIIQKTLAKKDGTQCGYCTPGWVMALYSLLKNKKLNMLQIEKSLASNNCRCTGYRPILDASKSFAVDAPPAEKLTIDIEDLDICKEKACSKKSCDEFDWCFVDLKEERVHIKLKDDREWFKIQTTAQVFEILNETGDDSYMLVAGNTGKGVLPLTEYPRILIDIRDISELKGYYFDQNLVIGSGTTITELIDIFKTVSEKEEVFNYLNVLNEHLKEVAHIAVQNLGTIAGNLMIKHNKKDFPSDIFLILETVGAALTILQPSGNKKIISLSSFLQENMRSKIIYNVVLPPLSKNNHIATFKVMKRAQNSQAIVNAGFCYKLDKTYRVVSSRIIYSGLRTGCSRACKTEACLQGKNLFDNNTLQSAIQVLVKELIIEEMPYNSVEYRRRLAVGLFYKGLLSLCPPTILNSRYKSGAVKLHQSRGVSSGKQVYSTDSSVWPINEPINKVDGLIQCAGEAPYAEDLISLPNEVYAAFVLSTVGRGQMDQIDATKALNTKGVIAFYTAKDIPGTNSFTNGVTETTTDEVLLSDGEINFYNQPIGIIVAESNEIAQRAAKLVNVKYSSSKIPIVDVKLAKTLTENVSLVKTINASKEANDVVTVIRGNNTIYGQYHFCYENVVCVSWPTEEGISVRSSTQCTDSDQAAAARCLNIDQNRIDVDARRCGGAFGLKITRGLQVSSACTLVTYKLNRPCRFILPLRTTMRIVGKRFPSSVDYEVGLNREGVIQYMDYTIYEDNGYLVNERLVMLTYDVYYNCYQQDRFNFKAFDVITNTASNTFCRSPGSLEAITATETILERVSYELNIDPVTIRLSNLDPKYKNILCEMVDNLKEEANYNERKKQVEDYNSKNRWKKRGLRFLFMKWNSKSPYYSDVNISVLRGDGTVIITHGGVEIGQGINTKAIQVCAYYFGISVDKIKVKTNNTTFNPNTMATVGSTTSQAICIGVQRACENLLEKLNPLKIELNNPKWESLIQEAFKRGIDLQSHGFVTTKDLRHFDVYGITLAEVEIDVLTGEWSIRRVDLLEDVGRSVNPLVDIGQIEGAFIMGLGYFTTEELIYDKTGELLTDRTWTYKIPQALDIPIDFRVYFKPKPYNDDLILGAKVVGEPATVMALSVPFAMREAIVSARNEAGIPSNKWFQIDGPYTTEKICEAAATDVKDFKFY